MYLRRLVALLLLLFLVAACQKDTEPAPDIETPVPLPQPTMGESPLSPSPTPTPPRPVQGESPLSPPPTPTPPRPVQGESPLPKPETSPLATPSSAVTSVVAASREHLARELDVPTQEVKPMRAESVEWPDASLGCPEAGKAYAQVITPGYRVVLRVDEREYELHTDREGGIIIICEPEP